MSFSLKRLLAIICGLGVVFSATFFVSCSDSDDDDSSGGGSGTGGGGTSEEVPGKDVAIKDGYFRICYNDPNQKVKDWWLWEDVDESFWKNPNWSEKAFDKFTRDGDWVYADVKLKADAKAVKFIPRSEASDAGKLTGDVVITLDGVHKAAYVNASGDVFWEVGNTKNIKGATITGGNGNNLKVIAVGMKAEDAVATNFTVKDKDGTALTISNITLSGTNILITLSDGSFDKAPYTVQYAKTTVTAGVSGEAIDEHTKDVDKDANLKLGVTISGTNATFATWAPMASKVELLLFPDATSAGVHGTDIGYGKWKTAPATPAEVKEMTAGEKGVWKAENVAFGANKYYKYRITNGEDVRDVADIWSYAASPDSVASQIVDINSGDAASGWETSYTNPFGKSGAETKKYNDAIIYEMHIRDWSRDAYDNASFETFASDENIAHLVDLGVTHVQILPMFDYAQTNADKNYNWGYNPYHYNVPEGRYVSNMVDGTDAVKQMRAMIKKLHDAGIAVIMDVVYNHTSGTGDYSLYDMTVPQYFYRMKDDGSYSNGSGCGNETATNHAMVKKYVIDSLKHWMNDYHINGFRFDLMGVHEKSTMAAIYDALYDIDKNVLVYGEPWTGGDCAVVDGAVSAGKATKGYGYGAFDDDFRDGVKGGEFGGFHRGIVNGTLTEKRVLDGLLGKEGSNHRNSTGVTGLSLRYVECHDNYTLFDKLLYSKDTTNVDGNKHEEKFVPYFAPLYKDLDKYIEDVKKEDKLAAAFVLLSQGTPFMNGGQDFLRTKQGNPDSYAADNKGGHQWTEAELKTCNQVDLSMKTKYSDVYNTYKGLIALRKANSAAFSDNTTATTEWVKNGVVKYDTGDFRIYFNASDAEETMTTTGYTKAVDVTSGAPTESTTIPPKVVAKSFVILKK